MSLKVAIVTSSLAVAAVGTGIGVVAVLNQNSLVSEPNEAHNMSDNKAGLVKDRVKASYFSRCSAALMNLADDAPKNNSKIRIGTASLNTTDFKRASIAIGSLAEMIAPEGTNIKDQFNERRTAFKAQFKGMAPELLGFTDNCLKRSYAYAPAYISEMTRRRTKAKG